MQLTADLTSLFKRVFFPSYFYRFFTAPVLFMRNDARNGPQRPASFRHPPLFLLPSPNTSMVTGPRHGEDGAETQTHKNIYNNKRKRSVERKASCLVSLKASYAAASKRMHVAGPLRSNTFLPWMAERKTQTALSSRSLPAFQTPASTSTNKRRKKLAPKSIKEAAATSTARKSAGM